MSAHTPGEWSLPHFAHSNPKCQCGYVFAEGQHGMGAICTIEFGDENEPLEVAKANAHLISSAPDLLYDLSIAAVTLRRYEASHRAKDTPDSLAKAEVNAELAARFEATIAKAMGVKP